MLLPYLLVYKTASHCCGHRYALQLRQISTSMHIFLHHQLANKVLLYHATHAELIHKMAHRREKVWWVEACNRFVETCNCRDRSDVRFCQYRDRNFCAQTETYGSRARPHSENIHSKTCVQMDEMISNDSDLLFSKLFL